MSWLMAVASAALERPRNTSDPTSTSTIVMGTRTRTMSHAVTRNPCDRPVRTHPTRGDATDLGDPRRALRDSMGPRVQAHPPRAARDFGPYRRTTLGRVPRLHRAWPPFAAKRPSAGRAPTAWRPPRRRAPAPPWLAAWRRPARSRER